jgi:Fe-S-cluster-containing hydrogenase component 2
MARVERRDKEPTKQPDPKKEPSVEGGKISRREFIVGSGAGVAGLVIGGVVGNQLIGKKAAVVEPTTAAPATTDGTAPAAVEYKAGYQLYYDPYICTGCNMCAVACSEHWSAFYYPDETKDTVNLEFSRIRPMRFQYVDVVNVCSACKLVPWAEGSDKYPCEFVCPEEAIQVIPEGEGVAGYYGMGYKWVDREKCLGADKCWRCAEICEEQFGSAVSFDPIEKKAQICSRCGGDPQCVKACPEPGALSFGPAILNGRYYAYKPTDAANLLFRKMYNSRRKL